MFYTGLEFAKRLEASSLLSFLFDRDETVPVSTERTGLASRQQSSFFQPVSGQGLGLRLVVWGRPETFGRPSRTAGQGVGLTK